MELIMNVSVADRSGPAEIFELEIEGRAVAWGHPTITTEEIARLGGWDPAQGVIMVDRENTERTLNPGERIEIKPGLGFGKRIRWKRG
ncbi:multiubiquitin domain-containing protein [Bradyrhizobium canariense]|nr:multiubiquitin domain-containing protein [Bradyrhizobium canariense]